MNKKAILFDGQSKVSNSGKTTSSILLLKKLIKEGYSVEEFYVHTPGEFQKYCNKNGLNPTCGKILGKCNTHKYYNDFASYKLDNSFIGKQNDTVFTYNDLIKGKIDFFCLLHKDEKWVLIYSPGDYALFIAFLLLVVNAILQIYSSMDTFIIVTTIKDKFKEEVLDVLTKVEVYNSYHVYTTMRKRCSSDMDKDDFYLLQNNTNVQDAFGYIQS